MENHSKSVGPHCDQINLTIDKLAQNKLVPITNLTIGVVLELKKYASTKKLSFVQLAKWLSVLTNTSQNEVDVKKARTLLSRISDKKNKMRKSKKNGQISLFEKESFHLPKINRTLAVSDTVTFATNTIGNAAAFSQTVGSINVHKKSVSRSVCKKKRYERLIGILSDQIQRKKSELRIVRQNLSILSKKSKPVSGRNVARNVNKREKRIKLKNSLLQNELSKLKNSNAELRSINNSQNQEIKNLKDKLRKMQKSVSYHKSKNMKKQTANVKTEKIVNNLKSNVLYLENKVETQGESNSEYLSNIVSLWKSGNSYSVAMRKCVLELISHEVSTENVGKAIHSVACNLFQVDSQALLNLPSRQCVTNIVDEGQYLMRLFYAKQLTQTEHWGLARDGTQRKKRKVLDTSVVLDTGDILPLGFTRVAHEDSETIVKVSQRNLHELNEVKNAFDSRGALDIRETIERKNLIVTCLEKLSFFMTDRAANEKLANKKLSNWRDDILKDVQTNYEKDSIHSMYCMAHVLLGFSRNVSSELSLLQTSLEEESKLGRDALPAFRFWKHSNAALRIIKAISDLVGPVGDWKNGIRDKWEAYCQEVMQKSLISSYVDNRFNGLFRVASEIIHHYDNLKTVMQGVEKPNLYVQSALADLQDIRVVSVLLALSILYVKITEPFWNCMTSGKVPYLLLHRYIQPLLAQINLWLEHPQMMLAANGDPVFHDFPHVRSCLFESTFVTPPSNTNDEIVINSLCAGLAGIKKTICKQLVDFLPEGLYSHDPSTRDLQNTNNSGTTNIKIEQHFGSMDSAMNRRRNAKLHYLSTLEMLKRTRIPFMMWLDLQDNQVCSLSCNTGKINVIFHSCNINSITFSQLYLKLHLLLLT